jgi:hypothetical protein
LLNNALKQAGWTGKIMSSSKWREAAQKKFESTPWEKAKDDVRLFIVSQDELGLLTRENCSIFSNNISQIQDDTSSAAYIMCAGISFVCERRRRVGGKI